MNWKSLFFKVFAAMVITSATCFVTASFAVVGFLGMKIVTIGDNQISILKEIKHMNKSDEKLKDVLSEEIVQLKVQNDRLTDIIKDMNDRMVMQQEMIDEIILPQIDKPLPPKTFKPFSTTPNFGPKKKNPLEDLFPKLKDKPKKNEIDKYREQLEQKTIPPREMMQMQMKE